VILNAGPVLFAIVSPTANPVLGMRIKEAFPNSHFEVSNYHWLVVAPAATAEELSGKIGRADGASGLGLVYGTFSYWGRANQHIWE